MATVADPYAINQIVQELFAVPGNLETLQADPSALFDRYGLSAGQRDALRSGDSGALTREGLHPILQMHWALASNPALASQITARHFLEET